MIDKKDNIVPIFVLTGFLGSGKTTILSRLLSSTELSSTVVLINEFGEIALDHLLLEIIDEEVMLLESGCVCCSVRDDFSYSLLTLHEKRKRNIIPPFIRIILDTTGIADPIAIHRLIMSDKEINRRYSYGGTITVVDSVYGQNTLDHYLESVKQVSVAEQLVISKTDLSGKEQLESLEKRLRRINPTAPIMYSDPDTIPLDNLLNNIPDNRIKDIHSWLNSESYRLETIRSENCSTTHDGRFSTFCVTWTEAVNWDDFAAWLEGLLVVRGDTIYRLKGLLNIKDQEGPFFIQGVQHSFHAPVTLDTWPHGSPKTELIFITRDFTKQAAINSLECVLEITAK